MKRIFLILLGIVFIIGGIFVAILISKPNENEIPQNVTEEAVYSNRTNTENLHLRREFGCWGIWQKG